MRVWESRLLGSGLWILRVRGRKIRGVGLRFGLIMRIRMICMM